eukprot:TRINITY_DN16991_c0_g1_i1.p1 TRINITY_DN16991_c0_g1~~TRINITY_DN16991_c0_g1_i1.p1  ORF type:complete len:260 (+),score=52.58 TRINITY_DN16991_c0_g1_i1:58-837(+)
MRTTFSVLLMAAAVAGEDMMRVPGGHTMHKSCVQEVTNGGVVNAAKLEKCSKGVKAPEVQTYAMSVNTDGKEIMQQMNTTWNVPKIPTSGRGQVVYFWPGFKSTQPKMGLPVLQPVLQYGQHGEFWQLQSWFVDGNIGRAVTGPAIDVKFGDVITSFMVYNENTKMWTVSGTNSRTKETSVLHITREKTTNVDFHYAMLVLETIMPNGECLLYPSSNNVTFSNLIVNNKPAVWSDQVYTEHDCHQNITVGKDVTFAWVN